MTAGTVEILLVEDDYDLREAMLDTLETGGYHTVAVPNGLEALEWLKETAHPPLLILLDLMMPVMDGWTFREEQLKVPALAGIPVAVLSARADDHLDETVVRLRKPIRAKELLAFVAKYCRRPGGAK